MKTTLFFRVLFLCTVALFLDGCKKESSTEPSPSNQPTATTPDTYLPIKAGLSWKYRVTFPANVNVPYLPVIESPEGLLGSSITHGWGSWTQGTVDLDLRTTTVVDSSATVLSYETVLNQNAYKFFFYMTGNYHVQIRMKRDGNTFTYDLIGNLPLAVPAWKIARRMCQLSPDSLKNLVDITVPAGEFKDCVRSSIALVSNGTYLSAGVYPAEVYCAANKGIVKVIGKDRDGTILYTMELIQ